MSKKNVPHDEDIDSSLIAKGKDALEDFDFSKAVRVIPKTKQSKLIAIRLPVKMLSDIKRVALSKGQPSYQQLIKSYIAIGLENEARRASSVGFQVQYVWSAGSPATSGSPSGEFWQPEIAGHLPLEEESLGVSADKS